jgi:hypothetical protein
VDHFATTTPIEGHELVTHRDLIPSEANHPRAGNWYYALQLGNYTESKMKPADFRHESI